MRRRKIPPFGTRRYARWVRRYNRGLAEAEANWEQRWKPFSFRHVNPELARRAFIVGYTAAKGFDRRYGTQLKEKP